MGIETHTSSPPGGPERDGSDFARLRHARERNEGFAVGRYLQPPPMLFTRDGHNLFLGDMYRGQSCFLMCGGPSLTSHDLTQLDQRGILTMAVNNAAAVHRPRLWCSVDDPGNFSDAIWRDPGIQKFAPLCHMEKNFMVRDIDGQLVPSAERVGDMPAVFGYRRNEAFVPDQWLYEDTFNWGNHSQRRDTDGNKGSRSVMYVALRLLFYLGIRQVYLLGCDFRMRHGEPNYAFDQERSRSSVRGNNSSYRILNARLRRLLSYFERERFEIRNCTPDSGLTVFPSMQYEQAVEQARSSQPGMILTSGMYDRQQREKDKVKNGRSPKGDGDQPIDALDESLSPPAIADDLTLVIPLPTRATSYFHQTWATWMKQRPWFRNLPKLLIVQPEFEKSVLPTELIDDPKAQIIIAEGDERPDSADSSVGLPARHVESTWYLLCAPEAIAKRPLRWPLDEWFQPEADAAPPVFVACQWGYSKPADCYQRLDDWADGVEGLSRLPRLNLPFDAGDDRLDHAAISSWCFFGRTDWTREIATYLAADNRPDVSHATYANFCAERRGDPVRRIRMKAFGWDHSFRWTSQKIMRRCTEIVGRQGELVEAQPVACPT